MDDGRIRCLWILLAMVSEQTLHKTQVIALCTCTYFAMLHVHNIKQPLSYYTSQDITLCVCEPGYITEFVRSVLHMREQTIIIIPSPQEIAWDGASPPQVLCTLGLTCMYNSQINGVVLLIQVLCDQCIFFH